MSKDKLGFEDIKVGGFTFQYRKPKGSDTGTCGSADFSGCVKYVKDKQEAEAWAKERVKLWKSHGIRPDGKRGGKAKNAKNTRRA